MVAINNLHPQVIKVCRPLIIEDEVLKALVKKFSESVSRSLIAERRDKATVKCVLTHVTDFPDGTEKGCFIGLDFSGRIFRLVFAYLKGDRSVCTLTRLYEFPDQKVTGTLSKAVEYVARCVNNFIDTYSLYDKKLILGAACSFPMEQENLQEAVITDWNKDFEYTDSRKQDFFTQLKIALKKFKYTKGIYLISAVSNSTACLLSGLYKDPAARIGLFLGDIIDITYVERFKNMTAYTGDGLRTRTALGVQLKNFGDDGVLDFIRSEFDFQIDTASSNPGESVLEKLISGAYLGEIARLCIFKLASMGVILKGYTSPALNMKDSLKTSDLAMMEMDDENQFKRCKAVMRNLGYQYVSDTDCIQIRFISRCVARRSSNLAAVCLTAMIQRMESKDVRIIGDGFLLKDFPNYESYMMKKINQLKKPEVRYRITKGGKEEIGIGAGIVAHIYREGVIKVENKYRALPPLNKNKYILKDLPASLIECECQPERSAQHLCKKSSTKEVVCNNDGTIGVVDFAEPVFANSLDISA